MQNTEQLHLNLPTLPSGGGAITGLKGDLAGVGPDGAARLSIPLPVSAGRGYAPSLSLSYHSRSGNGLYGIGWDIGLSAIRRRTRKGVPTYDETDEFTGPDGEVVVPVLTENGMPETRSATTLLGVILGGDFSVRSYRARIETNFHRLEYWVQKEDAVQNFWVLYEPDGQIHLFGRNALACISHPDNPAQTAVWLHESSVSSTGEQIYYQYRAEDDIGCEDAEKTAHPGALAQRYLTAIWYGNKKSARELPALSSELSTRDWLFILVLDFGERDTDWAKEPDWLVPGSGNWWCRQDCFSNYEYGFNLRTRRLCRQVLMYHAVTVLAGQSSENDVPTLISRVCLDYSETPSVSTLKTLRQIAYEPDGTIQTLPPFEFDWQHFTLPKTTEWQLREDMCNQNLLQPYQIVDLNGEGLAGILYQDREAWWYSAPIRLPGDEFDAVTWGKATPLPCMPTLREKGILADLNGDGYLEWVVTAGHYDRTPEHEWRHCVSFQALPVEYSHPRALLADITGAGMTDLVLIGPKSVRLYSGTGEGWKRAQTVIQPDRVVLPIPGADARVLVAFSDMAGSGQQHLVEIRADSVRYWPALGHGRFGSPVSMPGFSQPTDVFNPEQLYLADIDGSGTSDLIYVHSNSIMVYLNQSGNRFAEPFRVPLPGGVRYDHTCSLHLADVQGLGVASLVLTVPHPVPRHWVCHLSIWKPWLLKTINNSMGARHTLYYRSSAQFWLDEKADALSAGKTAPISHLPFPLHTLWRIEQVDEITGNRLVSEIRYQHGVWDGHEHEFRGFGFVAVCDTNTFASQGTAAEISMPAISRNWYATGLEAVDRQLKKEYWQGDRRAFSSFTPRFTIGSGENEQVCAPDDAIAFWLSRGMKGMLLRSELYGADGSQQVDVPYRVTEIRPQVRLTEVQGSYPVVWPVTAESRTYVYERVSSDPQCSQQILLTSDEYGLPLRQVDVNYPRRSQPPQSPYPDTLPETLFTSSYDEQQQVLRLTLSQHSWHHLTGLNQGIWLHALANASRNDVFIHPATAVPVGGLTLERLLSDSNNLIGDNQPYTFAGQQTIWYLDAQDKATTEIPAFPPRVAFSESAVLDENIVTSLSESISADNLLQAGYTLSGYLFSRTDETKHKLWTVRQGYITYASADHFLLPTSYRDTLLTGAITATWDSYNCVITQIKDAGGLTTTASYDWRFLMPVSITDENDNVHAVTLDALGRLITMRFRGTEEGKATGYSDKSITLPATADEAISLSAPLPVHQCLVYMTDSWVKTGTEKLPPHVVVLTTDRYDSDPKQQVRQQVIFSDGFGRPLQTVVRHEAGEAWQRTDAGSLKTGADNMPQVVKTTTRWAVSGRTEYDNKGQVVRTYQPYFLDSWKYLSDDSARQDLYADTHYFDPTGREWQTKTSKGWLRCTLYTPWFTVQEDENDTVTETGSAV